MRTVLIDFIGTPGSGKSTVSHIMAEMLRGDGYSVVEPTYDSERKQSAASRILNKLISTVSCTISNKSPRKIFMSVDRACFNSHKERFKQYVNLCHVIKILSKCSGNDFIIADQGIAQAAVSLCNHCPTNLIPPDIVANISAKVGMNPIVIYITTGDIERNLTYLTNRKNGLSRVDMINTREEKIAALTEIQAVIHAILPQCGNYTQFVTDAPIDSDEKKSEIKGIIRHITGAQGD